MTNESSPPPSDALWRELTAMARRAAPRYADCGTCAVCAAGPTAVLPLGGAWWGCCEPCGCGWYLGLDVFDLDGEAAHLAELHALTVHAMAACTIVITDGPTR